MAFEKYTINSPKGLNFSLEPAQLPETVWDYGHNIAFRHGVTKKVDGYDSGLGLTGKLNDSSVYPQSILALRDDTQNYYWWAYVDDNSPASIYRVTAKDNHVDVTPTNPINTEENYYWSNDSINAVPYFTYRVPYKWDGVSRFEEYRYFPTHVNFKNIRTYKNFHIGLNFKTFQFDPEVAKTDPNWCPQLTSEQRQDYAGRFSSFIEKEHQNAIWWSASVVGKDVDVSWADADPTSDSGWNFLGGAGGPIIEGKVLRDSFIIYRERSIWQMTYVGGINVFAFKELFTDVGCLGPHCVVEVDGWHYVIGQSDVYKHNGVQKRSIVDGIIRKEIFDTIDPEFIRNVFIAVKYHDKELWVCVPEVGSEGYCTLAYVYNWEEGSWSVKDMPKTKSSTYAIISVAEDIASWNDEQFQEGIVGSTWEEQTSTWSAISFTYNPSEWGLIFSGKVGNKNYLFTSNEQPILNGDNFKAVVEKKWLDLGDRSVYKTFNKIYPMVREGDVDVYISGTSTIVEYPSWKYLGRFNPEERMYLSGHATGRFLHVKFEIPEKSRAEIKGFDIEYTLSGGR